MRNLRELGLAELIRARAEDGVPLLGICLGMQLLFESSEELEPTEGLGLIPGEVTRASDRRAAGPAHRLERGPLRAALAADRRDCPRQGCAFYHVHSFAPRPCGAGAMSSASTEYGERFATIVERGRVFGVQFHPEKSSADGLRLLENFVATCAGTGASSGLRLAAGA